MNLIITFSDRLSKVLMVVAAAYAFGLTFLILLNIIDRALFDGVAEIVTTSIVIIVFLQATSPLRLFDDIDNAITHFINMNVDSMFSATKIDDLTIWRNKNSNWESINFDYKNRLRRQQMSDNYIENGSIYIFKPEILKKCNNRLGGEMSIYKMHFWQTWEIDSIEEIDLIEYYLSKYELGGYGVI